MAEMIFDKENYDPEEFFRIAQNYLENSIDLPVLKAESVSKFDFDRLQVSVYFQDEVLNKICKNKKKFERDLKDIILYGFIGRCRSGKNGIVLLSPNPNSRDYVFGDIFHRFIKKKYSDFFKRIEFPYQKDDIEGIKVVTHRKNGERLYGLMNRTIEKVVLLGVESYER